MFGTCLLYLSAVLEPCVQLDWEPEDNLLSPVEEHQLQLRSSDLYPDPRVGPSPEWFPHHLIRSPTFSVGNRQLVLIRSDFLGARDLELQANSEARDLNPADWAIQLTHSKFTYDHDLRDVPDVPSCRLGPSLLSCSIINLCTSPVI
ncbi:hypothetical protein GOODEAATRI_029561 [Goodea atripinnis]|uniref:Uncharacterized protein n=1 Tax=Goodea atripinnis TaxID=208336 RepID=A0ABV0N5D7_9TELE